MSFHSLLNSIIDSQSVTKNSLINETGIDRSSFYQILSGKRIPTKDQITSIIRQLDISAADEMALYDAFYLERLGETNYHYLKFTEKCLRVIGSPYIDANASNNQTPSRSQELQNKLPDNPIDTDQSQAATGTILYHSTDEIICGLTKFLIHASKKRKQSFTGITSVRPVITDQTVFQHSLTYRFRKISKCSNFPDTAFSNKETG